MRTILFAAIIVSLCGPAEARIGETKEQCIKRYRKPTEDEGSLKWVKGNVEITASFGGIGEKFGTGPDIKGGCSSITFKPVNGTKFSAKQVEDLKKANGLGCEWGRFKSMDFTLGKYHVELSPFGPDLTFDVAPLKHRWPTDEEFRKANEPKRPDTEGF